MIKTSLLAAGQLMDEENNTSGSMHRYASLPARALGATVLLLALGLGGCSSHYVMRTVDGKVYNTQGAPQLVNGSYRFTDSNGDPQSVALSQVVKMQTP